MSKRLSYLDWAKALGIIMVCIGHFLPSGEWLKVLLYSFHVPLFAFVSGLLMRTPSRISESIKRVGTLVKRVLVPFALWLFVGTAIMVLRGRDYPYRYLLRQLFFLEGRTGWNAALWYAPTFFLAASLFYIICRLVRGNRYAIGGLALCSFGAVCLLEHFDVSIDLSYSNFLGIQNVILLFGFISLGFVTKEAVHFLTSIGKRYKNPALYIALAVFLSCSVIAVKLNTGNNISLYSRDYNNIFVFMLLAVALTVSFVLSCALLPSFSVAELLSDNSLFLMCSHYLFLHLMFYDNVAAPYRSLYNGLGFGLITVAIYIALLLILRLCHKWQPKLAKPLAPFGILI